MVDSELSRPVVPSPKFGYPRIFLDAWTLLKEWNISLGYVEQLTKNIALSYSEFLSHMTEVSNSDGNVGIVYNPRNHVDKEVICHIAQDKAFPLRRFFDQWKDDRDFGLTVVKNYDDMLHQLSPVLRSDREVVKAAIQKFGVDILYASPELQQDPELVSLAFANMSEYHIVHLGHLLIPFSQDAKFLLRLAELKGEIILKFASPELFLDMDFVVRASKIGDHAIDAILAEMSKTSVCDDCYCTDFAF